MLDGLFFVELRHRLRLMCLQPVYGTSREEAKLFTALVSWFGVEAGNETKQRRC